MKEWQWNVLFWVGVGGAVYLLFAPEFGLDGPDSPGAVSGIGLILAYILTQRKEAKESKPKPRTQEEELDE